MAQALVHMPQGADTLVVESGGTIDVKTGGSLLADGAQAAAIDDVAVTGTYATDDDAIELAINSILTALRNAGIIASA